MYRIIFRRSFGKKFFLVVLIVVAFYVTQKSIVVYDLGYYQTKLVHIAKGSNYSDLSSKREETHPLENTCKYPVLDPNEESIKVYVKHVRSTTCRHVMLELVTLGSDGILRVNQTLSLLEFNHTVKCIYRTFAGTLRPQITVIGGHSSFVEFVNETKPIKDDQMEVQCFKNGEKANEKSSVYQFAFAQVAPKTNKTFVDNSERLLSVDIIVLDSTSLNMVRRHMNTTLQYWLGTMGALHLEGYSKVADNSMVNLIPLLVGKRYGDQGPGMPSEYAMDKVLDLEKVPFIWKDYQAKGCATMFNDDPMHFTRGLFHYPWEEVHGFVQKPTDHYFRPWHVYHRRFAITNASEFCFGNTPYYKLQLNLIEQMINRYKDKCHFSFSFFTELPHDNPSHIEQMDETLAAFLKRIHSSNAINRTVLIIMGDHGNRIGEIMYSYVGRIEERMPFFSVYFPEWFRRKHPDLIRQFVLNKNRLTTHYDSHEMLRDLLNAKYDTKVDKRAKKGISLFQDIPKNRSCRDANIPEHHCTCLIKDPKVEKVDEKMKTAVKDVILSYTIRILQNYSKCKPIDDVRLEKVDVLTTSQMIQHGVRNYDATHLNRVKSKYLIGEIEYVETTYTILPTNVRALVRLQHDKKRNKLFVNVPPLVLGNQDKCFKDDALPKFCTCVS